MYKLAAASTLNLGSGAKPGREWVSGSESVSYILISDRAKDGTDFDLNSITPNSIGTGTGNPYIAILLDLRTHEGELGVHGTSNPVDDGPCLRIYAPGINTNTYPFLKNVEGVKPLLKSMLEPPVRSKERTPSAVLLRDQVFFRRYGRD